MNEARSSAASAGASREVARTSDCLDQPHSPGGLDMSAQASRSEAMMVAVDFSPRTGGFEVTRRGATVEGRSSCLTVQPSLRDARSYVHRGPWAQAHGYHRCLAPRDREKSPNCRARTCPWDMSPQSKAAQLRDANEEWLEMPLIEILCHGPGNRRLALFQQVQITVTHFGGDLVADVQQLPQIRIKCLAVRVVAQGIDELV